LTSFEEGETLSRRRTFRLLAGFVATGLAVSLVAATTGGAAKQPEAIGGGQLQASYYTPQSQRSDSVVAIVQLSGASIAQVEAQQPATRLSANEKAQIRAELQAQQNSIKPAIQNLGGQIRSDFQNAYNGISVRIARNQLAALRALPNVTAVHVSRLIERDNAVSVPYLGVPAAWSAPFFYRGLNQRIAVIDTGIDFTHGNFRAAGTVATPAEYAAANAADTVLANPALLGPLAAKVKGGIDFVGDGYNASAPDGSPATIPHPDPNPLDCNGHGSHVAGSAAGFGVLANGSAFGGPYNSLTHSPNKFLVGPGVAPRANLYAVRVFGCLGSTTEDIVVEAIEWSLDNGMHVINMSIGSPFGMRNTPGAVAATNAARAGVVVVTSAGNNGSSPYVTGGPGVGSNVISTAANESLGSFPGFTLSLPSGSPNPITGINANGETDVADGTQYTIVSVNDDPGTTGRDESLGCSVADFPTPPNATSMAVVVRGVCARVAKAIFGQQAGYAAVAMVNNATSLPPFEGPIFSNPDDGVPFTVTIPFIGVRGLATTATSDGARLRAASGSLTTVNNTSVANPNFSGLASFTSGGPRTGDSFLKPWITAPGVSIFSTGVGTGNKPAGNSGTSMSSPHVAGVAALVRQAHPGWFSDELTAAIVNTGDPAAIGGATPYRTSRAGTGLVSPLAATRTEAVAFAGNREPIANFGFFEGVGTFSETRRIRVWNKGASPITFTVGTSNAAGSPHTATPSTGSITVPAGAFSPVDLTLVVAMGTAGNASAFREVAGLVTFTPTGGGNNDVTLRVPYYLVPRALSRVDVTVADSSPSPTTTATVTNDASAAISGNADFYAWGLRDGNDLEGSHADMRAVGVQSFVDGANRFLVFAVSAWQRWSNAASAEFDIFVDVDPLNGNGDDYIVVGADVGAVTAGVFDGRLGSFVFSTRSGGAGGFLATAPTDGTTALLPASSTQFCRTGEPCLNAANPRFTYHATGFDLLDEEDDAMPGIGRFNAFSPAIFTENEFDFLTVAPGASASTDVTINATEWALTPARGLMVVTQDNAAGEAEAKLIEMSQ
jgi:subtilisin family serine protease